MTDRILVTYASEHGATAGIAERIAEAIQAEGLQVDVQPVDRVEDVSAYNAVVLGSAVYVGRWPKEAVTFLQEHEKTLAGMPVWLFSSGPTGEGDPVELMEEWRLPKKVEAIAERIAPRDVTVFHGVLDPNTLNFIERSMIKKVNAPVGDFRDWEAIRAWAKEIWASLREVHATEEVQTG